MCSVAHAPQTADEEIDEVDRKCEACAPEEEQRARQCQAPADREREGEEDAEHANGEMERVTQEALRRERFDASSTNVCAMDFWNHGPIVHRDHYSHPRSDNAENR